jgi:hypothetical protein
MLNMSELCKHYAEWKKLDTEDHILYDSIYTKCLENQIHRNNKHIIGCQSLLRGYGGWLLMGIGFLLWGDGTK